MAMEATGTMDSPRLERSARQWWRGGEGALPGASASGGAEGIRGRPEVRGARGEGERVLEPGLTSQWVMVGHALTRLRVL